MGYLEDEFHPPSTDEEKVHGAGKLRHKPFLLKLNHSYWAHAFQSIAQ